MPSQEHIPKALPPHQRRAIYILEDSHIDALEYEDGGPRILLSKEIQIVSYEQLMTDAQNIAYLARIRNSNSFGATTLLVQSPFEADVYEELSDAPSNFAIEKYFKISEVCQLLGAKSLKIEEVQAREERRGAEARNRADVNLLHEGSGSISTTFEMEAAKQLKSKLSMHDTFHGSAPNPNAAKSVLRDAGIQDALLDSLIQQRSVETNLISGKSLTLSLSSESKRNLNVTIDALMNGPAFLKKIIGVNIEGGLNAEHFSKLNYELTVTIKF